MQWALRRLFERLSRLGGGGSEQGGEEMSRGDLRVGVVASELNCSLQASSSRLGELIGVKGHGFWRCCRLVVGEVEEEREAKLIDFSDFAHFSRTLYAFLASPRVPSAPPPVVPPTLCPSDCGIPPPST
jgi:hypothetical protein